jgi:hypothetical protein
LRKPNVNGHKDNFSAAGESDKICGYILVGHEKSGYRETMDD